MAEAQLSVELTAKIDGLRDNFNTAIREVGKLDKDTRAKLSSIDKGFADLANSVEQNISGKLSGSVKSTSTSVSKNLAVMAAASAKAGQGVQAGSNRAGQALVDLGRIAQDAPFGFIGIQNNIGPLIESFGRLKAESGSTGGAIKALTGSLIGPAGFGLAIAAVSAGILLYQQYQQRSRKETEEQAKALKNAKKNSEDYALTLDVVSRANLVGAQNALKERTELKTLYDLTQNTTFSLKQRGQAVDELQKKYPEYFKNIKDENFLNGLAKTAYDNLSVSILATARARAAQEIQIKNASRQLDDESKIAGLRIEQQKALNEELKLEKINKSANRNTGGSSFGNPGSLISEKLLNGARERRLAIDKQIVDLSTDHNLLTSQNLRLETAVTDQIKKGADLSGKVGDLPTEKKGKHIKTLSEILKELNVNIAQVNASFDTTFDEKSTKKIDAYQKAIDALIKIGFKPASDAIRDLKKEQVGLFTEKTKRNADEFFNSVLPARLVKETKANLDKAKKALKDAQPSIQEEYEKLLNPSASDKFKAKNLTSKLTLDSGDFNVQSIKEDMQLLTEQFNQGGISLEVFEQKYKGLSDSLKKAELGKSLQDLSRSFLESGIGDIGSSIGQALAEGANVFEALGTSLLKSFGGFLSEYGRLLIAYGTAALFKAKLDAAAAIPGAGFVAGPAAIAAGIALQIAGSAIGAFASGKGQNNNSDTYQKPTAFANGGLIYGPTLGLMGEYAGAKSDPEVVAPLSKLKSILGQTEDSTLGAASTMGVNGGNVFNSTTNSYGVNGNNQPNIIVQAPEPIVMTTRFEVEGEKLVLITERAKKRLNRIS